jgi:taurine--2-oxoglutarate transaminase
MADVAKFLRDNGLYTFVRWNWVFAVPPLCITESQLKDGLAIIDQALEITDAATK